MSATDLRDARNRIPITFCVLLATLMSTLDSTVANVALPSMQGSLSAGADQIMWVLTSYLVAVAIATPLTGWMTEQLGRKRMFLLAIGGFTIASMLCGLAANLPQIVLFRFIQGVFGAPLIPLSQAQLLDINPPERHGRAMAVWGIGTLLGPILGPAVGGWFTEQLSWRWCFYINLPIGILTLVGVWIFVSSDRVGRAKPFDFLGFGMLALAVGALQLVLDRGPGQGWFASAEIWTEALLAAAGLWVFVTHTLTAKHPFFDPALVRDRNFITANFFNFCVGLLLFSTMALAPPMLQILLGYPPLSSGMVMMPRGLGSWAAMFVVGALIGRVDTRLILASALAISALSLWQMTQFDLAMDSGPVMFSGVLQGFGMGMMFPPLSALAFATLPANLRSEGAAVYSLVRSIGSAVGISMMQALANSNQQAMHASLAAHVIPSDAVVRSAAPTLDLAALGPLDAEITRQAMMVAYIDDYRLMFILTLLSMPMLLLLRQPRPTAREPLHAAAD